MSILLKDARIVTGFFFLPLGCRLVNMKSVVHHNEAQNKTIKPCGIAAYRSWLKEMRRMQAYGHNEPPRGHILTMMYVLMRPDVDLR